MTKEINIVNLHKAEVEALMQCHAAKMARRVHDGAYNADPTLLKIDTDENLRLSRMLNDFSYEDLAS
jgi:hypothetical protein